MAGGNRQRRDLRDEIARKAKVAHFERFAKQREVLQQRFESKIKSTKLEHSKMTQRASEKHRAHQRGELPLIMSELRRYKKAQRRYNAELHKIEKEKKQNLEDELFKLPHEIEMPQYAAASLPSRIVPTSRLLVPLRRLPYLDELSQTGAEPSGKKLTHLTSTGEANMVSVAAKPDTKRTAVAIGTVRFSNLDTYDLVTTAALKKGDVLSISRIAGIQAAKMCPSIIPLCHPIMISSVKVDVVPFKHNDQSGISIEGKVECTGPTGVEMEALTAIMGAALTVIDMIKAVDKAATIEDVRVVYKSGGKSGDWIDEEWSATRDA
jgi:molybdenum cofactor biosynthesis protein MoaC